MGVQYITQTENPPAAREEAESASTAPKLHQRAVFLHSYDNNGKYGSPRKQIKSRKPPQNTKLGDIERLKCSE